MPTLEKLKCYVSYTDGDNSRIVFRSRNDALEESQNQREQGYKAYVRVRYYTQKELDELPEYD